MFYFVRHGKTDYTERNTKIYQGFGVNLAGLSGTGKEQIRKAAKDERMKGIDLILCSPYTRAVQTAAILSGESGADIVIETDLHEWLANKNFVYEDDGTAERAYEEYERNHGRYPVGREMAWEDAASMKKRVLGVLEKYASYGKVAVACHGMMIQAVTGGRHPECGEIIEFDLRGQ